MTWKTIVTEDDAGSGLTWDANGISVGAGTGITVNTNDVQISDGGVDTLQLAAGAVTNTEVDAAAAIALTKLDDFYGQAAGVAVKEPVRAATTANITLSGTQTIDGVNVVADDRVLVRAQSTGADNGIYICAAGAWSRAADASATGELIGGTVVWCSEGTSNGNEGFILTTDDPITMGSTAQTWTKFTNLSGTGLLADGSVPLTANWDAGSFDITAEQFHSDITTGTAPFTVASTTVVTNLNADQVDGLDSTALVLVDGSQALTANWDAGSFEIRAQTFQSDQTTGTAPFTVASTTVVTNLNADTVDGIQGANIVTADGTTALTANWDAGSFDITAEQFHSDIATGTAPFTVASTTVVTNLNADQVDGLDSTALVLVDGSQALTANWDAGSFDITAEQFHSDITTGTAPFTVASTTVVTNLNADQVDGLDSTDFSLVDGSQAYTNPVSGVTPTADAHLATKGYVDSLAQGLDVKASVVANSPSTSTLGTGYSYNATGGTSGRGQITWTSGPTTAGGVTLANDDRILNSETGAAGGIWVRTAQNTWDRATDFDEDDEVTSAAFVFVEEGDDADNGYVLTTNDPITIGGGSGTSLSWSQFSGAGQITAGAGLTKSGNTINAVAGTSQGGITVNADDIELGALTAAWDAGSYEIRALTFQSDQTTGTAPFTVASTTVVTNLNADQVDGLDSTALVLVDGSQALTANWDAGSFDITAEQFHSDIATGTAPFTVASTTVVTNLNADTVDGVEGADIIQRDGSVDYTGSQSFGLNAIEQVIFEQFTTAGRPAAAANKRIICVTDLAVGVRLQIDI